MNDRETLSAPSDRPNPALPVRYDDRSIEWNGRTTLGVHLDADRRAPATGIRLNGRDGAQLSIGHLINGRRRRRRRSTILIRR